MTDLVLSPGLLEKIIRYSKSAYPNEACGLLAGRGTAERFIPMNNISAGSDRYEMDPTELIATLRGLRDGGEELVANCHSHPHGPAEPSKIDIERAYYPEAAHLIVSLAEPERPRALAFRIAGGEAIPIEVHVIV